MADQLADNDLVYEAGWWSASSLSRTVIASSPGRAQLTRKPMPRKVACQRLLTRRLHGGCQKSVFCDPSITEDEYPDINLLHRLVARMGASHAPGRGSIPRGGNSFWIQFPALHCCLFDVLVELRRSKVPVSANFVVFGWECACTGFFQRHGYPWFA